MLNRLKTKLCSLIGDDRSILERSGQAPKLQRSKEQQTASILYEEIDRRGEFISHICCMNKTFGFNSDESRLYRGKMPLHFCAQVKSSKLKLKYGRNDHE